MRYDYPMMNGNDAGWGFIMMLFWLVFLVVVAVVVVHLLKHHGHDINTSHKTEPIDIAKERYAKGEITKEQFEQLKKDLAK
jgi:putative membrane protein